MKYKFLNTTDSYGFISKHFHWVMAILLLLNFSLGFIMGDLERGPLRSSLFHFHKSMGILLLGLIILRLLWSDNYFLVSASIDTLYNVQIRKKTSVRSMFEKPIL